MKELNVTVYESEDGVRFQTKDECMYYERCLIMKHITAYYPSLEKVDSMYELFEAFLIKFDKFAEPIVNKIFAPFIADKIKEGTYIIHKTVYNDDYDIDFIPIESIELLLNK